MLFLLPSSVPLLSASLPFPGLCAFLCSSLPIRPASLSSFRISCLVRVPAFVPLFSCTVSSSSSPQFLRFCFSFLYFRVVTVPLSCLSSLLYIPFRSSSSTPHLQPPLGLLCCLCFSTVLRISHPPPGLLLCSGVWSLFVGWLRRLRFQLLLHFCFVLWGSSVRLLRLLLSSLLFRIPHSWLLLLVFLFGFPWADALVTPSRLAPSMSPLPGDLLGVFFSPASVPPQLVYRSSLCVPTAFCGGSVSFGS